MRPSLLMMNPEPMPVFTRFMILKGSMEVAAMNTTDGETSLKTSGIESVKTVSAFESGMPNPILKMHKKIKNNNLLKLLMAITLSLKRSLLTAAVLKGKYGDTSGTGEMTFPESDDLGDEGRDFFKGGRSFDHKMVGSITDSCFAVFRQIIAG